jgi:AraC-like DNA-binding protein
VVFRSQRWTGGHLQRRDVDAVAPGNIGNAVLLPVERLLPRLLRPLTCRSTFVISWMKTAAEKVFFRERHEPLFPGHEGTLSMRFRFSTDSVEPEGRFEAFRDNLARRLFQFDMHNRSAAPYRGVIDLTVTGQMSFGQVYGSAAQFFRTEKLARQCEEGVWLLLNRRGRVRVSQGDFRGEVRTGDGFVINSARAHEGECLVESDTWVIKVPEDSTRVLRHKDAASKTAMLPAAAPITRLLHALLDAHYRLGDLGHEEAEMRLGYFLADLVALAMGPSRDGAELAKQRGLKAAQLQAVLDDIGLHFAHPNLSAADVALRLGISSRYVHLLLEETGLSFSEHVLEKRLTQAYSTLANPARLPARIGDIAFECGFSDLSHFNRSFRRRFGCTPREVRTEIKTHGGS